MDIMTDGRPEGKKTGPGPPMLNIDRWRDGLGLRWSFEDHSIKAVGFSGKYTIMRIAALWVMTYFHLQGKDIQSIITKGSRRLEGAVGEVKKMERQVLFDEILEKTVRNRVRN